MRLAVVSDTHGNGELLARALSLARAGGRLQAVVHLGDEHTDLQGLVKDGELTLVTPGLQHPDYGGGTLPVSRVEEFEGLVVAMAHQPSDLPAVDDGSRPRLYLHGHTHSLTLSVDPWGLRFNPGHLTRPIDRGRPCSFGIVEIEQSHATIRGIGLSGDPMLESRWPMDVLARKGG